MDCGDVWLLVVYRLRLGVLWLASRAPVCMLFKTQSSGALGEGRALASAISYVVLVWVRVRGKINLGLRQSHVIYLSFPLLFLILHF
jgi:hypothetical protein